MSANLLIKIAATLRTASVGYDRGRIFGADSNDTEGRDTACKLLILTHFGVGTRELAMAGVAPKFWSVTPDLKENSS